MRSVPAGLTAALMLAAAGPALAEDGTPTIPAEALVAAITLAVIVCCVSLHYEGLTYLQRRLGHADLSPRRLRVLFGIIGVLLMHAVEIILFAIGYLLADLVPGAGSIGGIGHRLFLDVCYFSAITYTTVGYGDLAPIGALRFLAAAESLVGFVLVSWSASFTYLVMERYWGQRRP